MREKVKFHLVIGANALLIIVVLIFVNLISLGFFSRIDLTEDGIYTLSPSTRQIMNQLDDNLLVKCYFTKELPAPYNTLSRDVQDKLDELKAYSRGYLKYEFSDPVGDSGLEERIQKLGIPPRQANILRDDKFESKKVYMGIEFIYEGRNEIIPFITSAGGLEYDFIRIIKRLVDPEKKTIGFLQGNDKDEFALDFVENLDKLRTALAQNYDVTPIRVIQGRQIGESVDVLVIPGPRKPLDDYSKYVIDQFIMRGDKVAFLVDRVDVNLAKAMITPLAADLYDWLAGYGIRINNDLAMDAQNRTVMLQQKYNNYVVNTNKNYPYFPRVSNFNRENPIVRDLKMVSFFYISTLDYSLAGPLGLTVEPLAYSSQYAAVQTPPFNPNPFLKYSQEDFDKSNLPLAVVVKGKFKSYFAERDPANVPAELLDDKMTSSPENRLLFIGDSGFIDNQFIGADSNFVFAQNFIDWLAQDESLISIRSKDPVPRPLKEVPAGTKRVVKYLNMLLMPFLVVIAGLSYWQIRRIRRKKS